MVWNVLSLGKPQYREQWDGGIMAHYYSKDGTMTDAYDAKQGMKGGKYPSVTTILSVLNKPGLNYWEKQGMTLTADSNRRQEGEDDKAYFKRVSSIFWEGQNAAKIGTALHNFAEKPNAPIVKGYEEICKKIREYQNEHFGRMIAEEPFCYEEDGYAGRIDVYGILKNGERAVCDYKSQKIKNGKAEFYSEFKLQLIAYGRGDLNLKYRSIIISSDPSNPIIEAKEYTREEMEEAWEAFKAAKTLWYWLNK